MAYASQSGRARTGLSNPQAHAICDRCGFRYNWVDLRWQYDWRGATMQNIKILVCKECYDKPQEQLRAIVIPADPTPIVNARIQEFPYTETDFISVTAASNSSGGHVTSNTLTFNNGLYNWFSIGQTLSGGKLAGGTKIISGTGPFVITPQPNSSWNSSYAPVKAVDAVTGIPLPATVNITAQDDENLTTSPIGAPRGLDSNAVMPFNGQEYYRIPVNVLTLQTGTALNKRTVIVTTIGNHGLNTGDQIYVSSSLNVNALTYNLRKLYTGMFSIKKYNDTQFTYEVSADMIGNFAIPGNQIKIFTVSVDLPYGYSQIPLT